MNIDANTCNKSRAISFDDASPLTLTPAHIKGQLGRNHTGQRRGHEIAWKSQWRNKVALTALTIMQLMHLCGGEKTKGSFNVQTPQSQSVYSEHGGCLGLGEGRCIRPYGLFVLWQSQGLSAVLATFKFVGLSTYQGSESNERKWAKTI